MHDSAAVPSTTEPTSGQRGAPAELQPPAAIPPTLGLPALGNRRAAATVDLAAITHNVELLKSRTEAALMAVVKADGYGHGAEQAARAALAGGADWLGVALPGEAVALRDAGIGGPLLAWLWAPAEDIGAALAANVTLGVSTLAQWDRVVRWAADRNSGPTPDIHLKLDTGLGRGGSSPGDWTELCRTAAEAEKRGLVTVSGLMSHLANAEIVGDPSVAEQVAAFSEGIAAARNAGLAPSIMHLANSAATLLHPETHFDLVRCGIAIYGLDPTESYETPRVSLGSAQGLRPAMTLRAQVVLTKRVPAGHGVSYGLTFRTPQETTLALVPLGYADGIPRAASGSASVAIGGAGYPVVGRIAMDQLVVDVGDAMVVAGDEVTIFGVGQAVGALRDGGDGPDHDGSAGVATGSVPTAGVPAAGVPTTGVPAAGVPTAKDWAVAADTIDYEIVTRIGSRVPRDYVTGSLT